MKVVDTERVVILMRFIQYGWDEERRKRFDDDLRMMLETQCEDLEEHDAKIRADVIEEFVKEMRKLWGGMKAMEEIEAVAEELKEKKV